MCCYMAKVFPWGIAPPYTHGRVSWDNDGMANYAVSHPDVLQFRKQGQPIVSLRVVNRD